MKCIEVTISLFLAAVVSAKPPNMVFMLMDDVRIATTSCFIINLLASASQTEVVLCPTNVSLRLIVACVVNSETRDPVGGARMDFAPLSTELFVYSYLVECPFYDRCMYPGPV